ncbi:hypothetical protein, partial [Vibrio parahaemolyticus]|uniref:hypothetical protein n=1 Tax=Vibrio parahaemolyticus TaxID=670 RepID=UPI00211383B8
KGAISNFLITTLKNPISKSHSDSIFISNLLQQQMKNLKSHHNRLIQEEKFINQQKCIYKIRYFPYVNTNRQQRRATN